MKIKRALISCWDKQGLEPFARQLHEHDVEIISSGGTAAYLEERQIPVRRIEDITGYPEVLGGRVKTLHPVIHAAILATDASAHRADLEKLGVAPLQLVVVNLYPFVGEAIAKNLPLEEAIEYIDIGGPTLLRGAAKNYRHVVALHHPGQYQDFLAVMAEHSGDIPESYRRERAREVFFYTSWYDGQIQAYLNRRAGAGPDSRFPDYQALFLEKKQDLRYGENPHQQAAVYQPFRAAPRGLAGLEQLWGKPLSFNNYADVHAAYALVLEFDDPGVAIIKHTNPCGAAIHPELAEAFRKALRGDSLSAFGGIVACNRRIDLAMAEEMGKIFFECIIAPDFEPEALALLQQKKNLRLLKLAPATFAGDGQALQSLHSTFLSQESDTMVEKPQDWKVVTRKSPTPEEWKELEFSWKLVKHVKSNAIILTRDLELYGVGAGQMSRVDSVKIARMKALQGERGLQGLALASDAFFPFRDGIDEAVNCGATAIIQPGGSIRDEEVIQAADEHQISMVFTGIRHFKH